MNGRTIVVRVAAAAFLSMVLMIAVGWEGKAQMQRTDFLPPDSVEGPPIGSHPELPLITEILPWPFDGEFAWIEFHNPYDKAIDPAPVRIVINDVLVYKFPRGLPTIPADAYIVVLLDGQGEESNQYEFHDNQLFLHTNLTFRNPFGPEPGQIATYCDVHGDTTALVGFVAWGGPGSLQSLTPERHRLWRKEWFVNMSPGFGSFDHDRAILRGYSIGRIAGVSIRDINGWVAYDPGDVSMASTNNNPKPQSFTPLNGAVVNSSEIAIGWRCVYGAEAYVFKIATDTLNGEIVQSTILDTETVTSPAYFHDGVLLDGDYFYQVCAVIDNVEREYSAPRKITSLTKFACDSTVELSGMQFKWQKKDTRLLCIDGCSPDDWDTIHDDGVYSCTSHGKANCARASISMVVSFYGDTLSQDRIAYYTNECLGAGDIVPDDRPEGDLAHYDGMRYYKKVPENSPDSHNFLEGEENLTLMWALKYDTLNPPPSTEYMLYGDCNPEWDTIVAAFDSTRPIMTRTVGHMRAMNGYCLDSSGVRWVHILDPKLGPRWETYESWADIFHGTWIGPQPGHDVRHDEASINTDADGDGIMDFDERWPDEIEPRRFGTLANGVDSDHDLVPDKADIWEYVFDVYQHLGPADTGFDIANYDGDDFRKEVDVDNDQDGFADGCEDMNRNGMYEQALEESWNFDSSSLPMSCDTIPLHLICLVDRSASMQQGEDKYLEACSTLGYLRSVLFPQPRPPRSKMGVVLFDESTTTLMNHVTGEPLNILGESDVSGSGQVMDTALTYQPDDGADQGGDDASTSIGAGLSEAAGPNGFNVPPVLTVIPKRNVVIVLTDGMENEPPFFNSNAVLSLLLYGQVDGYIVGLGSDDSQYDEATLRAMAHVWGGESRLWMLHEAESRFELAAGIITDLLGLEEVPPGPLCPDWPDCPHVNVVPVDGVALHDLPVDSGTELSTLVFSWDDPDAGMDLTLMDPTGNPSDLDTTARVTGGLISTFVPDMPGRWTARVTAYDADPTSGEPPDSVAYSLSLLERNNSLHVGLSLDKEQARTGESILLTARANRGRHPIKNAEMILEVTRPTIGVGKFNSLYTSDSTGGPSLEDISPSVTQTIVPNDKGMNGDYMPGDGVYSAYFDHAYLDGHYTFRLSACEKDDHGELLWMRQKAYTVRVTSGIDPALSIVRVLDEHYEKIPDSTYFSLEVIPLDHLGNMVGPGHEKEIVFDIPGVNVLVLEYDSNGGYKVDLAVPGTYTGIIELEHVSIQGSSGPVGPGRPIGPIGL